MRYYKGFGNESRGTSRKEGIMPIYPYKCSKCGYEFEAFQNINDDVITKCLRCKKPHSVKRLIPSTGGFILKGSGWYKDGYSKTSPKKSDKK